MASKNQTTTSQSQQSQSITQAVINSELLAQILEGLQDAGYTQKTTDELMKIAEDYYLPQYNAEIEAAQQAQAVKDMSYTQQLENLQSAYGKNINVQNAAYDKSRAALETGALARGMGRSSYTMATRAGNDQARSAALAQLADDYLQNVRQVTDEQTLSAAQSAETIGRLNADKATNITNKLRELADAEYQKYITGVNQQNANYLAAVQAAYEQGFRHFLCGMARGCDFWFCEAVLELRKRHEEVSLEAVIPYAGQTDRWSEEDRERYRRLLSCCNYKTTLQETYSAGCMYRRNRYLVDHAALLIAVHDGLTGGTQQTMAYAMRRGIEIMDTPSVLEKKPCGV